MSITYLQDRYKERFPVKNRCNFCYNEIYNSKIYDIGSEMKQLKSLGFLGYRLDFTLEDAKETSQVLDRFETVFTGTKNDINFTKNNGIVTKGHFKRGVE